MKRILWTSLLTVALNLSASAGLFTYNYSSGFQNGGIIPDGSADGWSDSRTISGLPSNIEDVNVYLTLSGGANGDLYAYLSHNGTLVPLLNRVGTGSGNPSQQVFGFSTAGFNNVKLDDSGSLNIHDAATPASSPTAYTPDGGSLASFTGSPNGSWTLFFSDTVGGNDPSTMLGWSLEITAVPEPVNVALGVFGGGFLAVLAARSRRVRDRVRCWKARFVRWVDAV